MSIVSKAVTVTNIEYPSHTTTEGASVDIYLSGCYREPKCEGCHNPELWDVRAGEPKKIFQIVNFIRGLPDRPLIDSIALLGGEPMHQNNIEYLLMGLSVLKKSVWLYTSYELTELPNFALFWCDFIKTGVYKEDEKTPIRSRLASYNQKIYKKEKNGSFELYYGWDGNRKFIGCEVEVNTIRPKLTHSE